MLKQLILKLKGVKKMNKKALIIGINNYPGNELEGCINDANEVSGLLQKNYDDSNNFEVIQKNDLKSKDELFKLIKILFSNDDDIALLYFSGHGYRDEKDEYICTPDFTPEYPGVKLSDILAEAQTSKCKNKIVILDSCYSGGMGKNALLGNAEIISPGVTILSASRDYETSAESKISKRGIFTTLLCEALKGGAADLFGQISPGSVYAYIDKALGRWQQRPLFKTNVQEFVCLRNSKPPIDVKLLRQITSLFTECNSSFTLDPSYEFTNGKSYPNAVEPYAVEENVNKFQILQKYERVGLVVPENEEFMYFAAMHSKSCKLTPLGQYYWMLAKNGRF